MERCMRSVGKSANNIIKYYYFLAVFFSPVRWFYSKWHILFSIRPAIAHTTKCVIHTVGREKRRKMTNINNRLRLHVRSLKIVFALPSFIQFVRFILRPLDKWNQCDERARRLFNCCPWKFSVFVHDSMHMESKHTSSLCRVASTHLFNLFSIPAPIHKLKSTKTIFIDSYLI